MTRSLALVLCAVVGAVVCSLAGSRPGAEPDLAQVQDASCRVGLAPFRGWIPNRGQWGADVLAAARGGGGTLAVGASGALSAVCAADGSELSIRPLRDGEPWNWQADVGTAAAEPPRPRPVCHFLGTTPDGRSVRDVPAMEQLAGTADAGGGALTLRVAEDGAPAYDLEVANGRDLSRYEFAVHGAETLYVDPVSGDLLLDTGTAVLTQSEPVAWIEGPAGRERVAVAFEVRGADRFGFHAEVGADRLLVDPELRWSTFVGGSRTDEAQAVSMARDGDVFVGGTTLSGDLPTDPSVLEPFYQGAATLPRPIGDAWVARLAADSGTPRWVTYLGGQENDFLRVLRAHGGEVVATGWTTSPDFPVTAGAFDESYNGASDGVNFLGGDVFVCRLSGDGTRLLWSTFVGGSRLEYPRSMEVDAQGDVYFAGHVHSVDFPTTPGAYRTTVLGRVDAYVARLASDGASLRWSTYFGGGGSGEEYPHGMHLDADGGVVLGGGTSSVDLPTTAGALGTSPGGGTQHMKDAFLMRFTAQGSLDWSTYIASPSSEHIRAVTRASDGTLVLAGTVDGPGLPASSGAFAPAHAGGEDGFVMTVAADASAALRTCYVGGSADEQVWGVAPLGGGRFALVGRTASTDLPVSRLAWATASSGGLDGLVWIVEQDLDALPYGTYFGGRGSERLFDVQFDGSGGLLLAGLSYSRDFPDGGSGSTYSGGGDAVVSRFVPLPAGVQLHGRATAGCAGAAVSLVRSAPQAGTADFAATFGPLPGGAPAVVLIGGRAATSPTVVLGAELWIEPATLFADLTVTSDGRGLATVPLPVPVDPALRGATFALQLAWADGCAPSGLAASSALQVTVLD